MEPRWVMLNSYGGWSEDDDTVIADAKTAAGSCTSAGRPFRVSFGIAAPPAFSFIHSDILGGGAPAVEQKHEPPKPTVIAAHSDSILFRMGVDCFVYTAGGASRRPSLSLLPASGRALSLEDTGILRRCDDELLVAELRVPYTDGLPRDMAELCVLRLGTDDWEVKTAIPIVHAGGRGSMGDGLPDWWKTVAAVPVGDRYMCWVNYLSGFLLCDMADKTSPPKLRYVQLPADLTDDEEDEDDDNCYCSNDEKPTLKCSRNMCAAGACSVRLVSVDSRCCCGGPGLSSCRRSRHAFTVTTWTLKLRTDGPMEWVKDGVLDSNELWTLPEYGSLPRVPLEYPIVSSEDTDVVCFVVRSDYRRYRVDSKTWMVVVNTRRKTLQSVVPCGMLMPWNAESIITAKLHY